MLFVCMWLAWTPAMWFTAWRFQAYTLVRRKIFEDEPLALGEEDTLVETEKKPLISKK